MFKKLSLLLGLVALLSVSGCNKCRKITCENGGECEKGECICDNGYSGNNCEIEDKCVTQNPNCQNEGTCLDGVCDCEPNWHGSDCSVRCKNATGKYDDETGDCKCIVGFEGLSCEDSARVKFLGTYDFTSLCNTMPQTAVIKRHDDPEYPERVIFTNLTTYGDNKAYAEIHGDTLIVPQQSVKANGISYTIKTSEHALYGANGFTLTLERKQGSSGAFQCEQVYTRVD